jgi:hypothetical protein
MDIEQANTIAMTKIFECLNIRMISEDDREARYASPIGNESGAIFIVNKVSNTWRCSVEQVELKPIDFACRLLKFKNEDHTLFDGQRWLQNMIIQPTLSTAREVASKDKEQIDALWRVSRTEPLDNLTLERYLEQRGIDVKIAKSQLDEVYVRHREKNKGIYTIGFKNDDGGYVLLNPFFEERIAPHTLTFLSGNGQTKIKTIHIFKDFIDYLTALTINPDNLSAGDVIVLNAYSHIRQAIGYIKNFAYRHAYTWLTNDVPGYRATFELADFFKTQDRLQHAAKNPMYHPHRSLNAFHMYLLNLDHKI